MDKTSKILVTGASGLIGRSLVRLLKYEGYENLLIPSHGEMEICSQESVYKYFYRENPSHVFHLAARVGGIVENNENPASFIYENTIMQCNIFSASRRFGVKKILFSGSACIYPRDAEQPIKESSFLTGVPEPTNIAYAVAKQNGVIMAQSYARQHGMNVVLPMLSNAYGEGDDSSHVIPMIMQKFRDAKDEIVLWGTGRPTREFIHADDAASAFLFLMNNYDRADIINVGSGEEYSIKALSKIVADLYSYTGKIIFDVSKPDGMPRKCLDSSRIRELGWEPRVKLIDGLRRFL